MSKNAQRPRRFMFWKQVPLQCLKGHKTAALESHLNMENISGSHVNISEAVEEHGQKW